MEPYYTFINVKCGHGYSGQLENHSNWSKVLGNWSALVERVYKCYGNYDYLICLKPTNDSYKSADECCNQLRSQAWVADTHTFFAKECYAHAMREREPA